MNKIGSVADGTSNKISVSTTIGDTAASWRAVILDEDDEAVAILTAAQIRDLRKLIDAALERVPVMGGPHGVGDSAESADPALGHCGGRRILR